MYPKIFQQLIDHFSHLPGIGPKMAERLVLSLFKENAKVSESFADTLRALHDVRTCTQCYNISNDDICTICDDKTRDHDFLCIVEEPLDLIPIERTRSYKGLYHVLGGTHTTKKNNHLTISALDKRITTDPPKEIIVATNFTTEGDATAFYLQNHLADTHIPITRLVRGLATGSDIEYADDLTLQSALTNRTKMV